MIKMLTLHKVSQFHAILERLKTDLDFYTIEASSNIEQSIDAGLSPFLNQTTMTFEEKQ